MKRQRIFVAAGAFILAAVSILAVNANKKRTGVTLYWQKGANDCAPIATVTTVFTTAGTGSTITFRNASGTAVSVYTSENGAGTLCQNAVNVRLTS